MAMTDLFNTALNYYGIKEIKGSEHNEVITKMHEAVVGNALSDETPWCSAFMNWICKECGYPVTRSLAARSWLEIGELVQEPYRGCLVVFWRRSPKSWQGHVGLYVREDEDNIWVIGGNQNNMVKITAYSKTRLLGYIELKKE